jgi:hypothetical protein
MQLQKIHCNCRVRVQRMLGWRNTARHSDALLRKPFMAFLFFPSLGEARISDSDGKARAHQYYGRITA